MCLDLDSNLKASSNPDLYMWELYERDGERPRREKDRDRERASEKIERLELLFLSVTIFDPQCCIEGEGFPSLRSEKPSLCENSARDEL